MIPRHRLADVSAQDILDLIAAGRPEDKTIDYKSELPGRALKDKHKFLADVTALANTLGGDIVYGIEEQRKGDKKTGVPQSIVGVVVESRDEEQLRLDAIIRSGVDPKIPGGVGMHWIPHPSEERPTLVLRVPRSLAGPHMVVADDIRRFFGRGTSGNFRMDVRELRAAFEMSGDIRKHLQSFRAERLIQIAADGVLELQAPSRTRLVLHIVPISAFELSAHIDLTSAPRLTLLSGSSEYSHFNLDGHLTYRTGFGYVQIFRTGALEAVDCYHADSGAQGRGTLPSAIIERCLIQRSPDYCSVLERLGAQAPYFLGVALVGVKGVQWTVGEKTTVEQLVRPAQFDRDVVVVPEIQIEPASDTAWPQRLRPAIDMLWQAVGRPGSPNYRSDGEWSPRIGI